MKNPWIRFLGIFGTVVLSLGILAAFVVGSFLHPFVVTHLLLGVGALAVWLLSVGVRDLTTARQVMTGRGMRYGANAAIYTAVFVGLLIVANYALNRNNVRWDTTEEGVFSLASQSVNAVKALKKPLELVVFTANEFVNENQAKDLLNLYRYHSTNVKAEVVDPSSKPQLVEKYEMKPGNITYLSYGEGETKAVSRINDFSEEAITNAILKLTRGSAKKIYYVQGHEEPGLEDNSPQGAKQLSLAFEDEHMKVEGIFLGQQSKIPDDAAAIILMSPRKPLLEAERKLLIDFANGGGRLLLFNDPQTTDDVQKIAGEFNIVVGQDVVIDQIQRLFAAPALGAQPVVRDYGTHPITSTMSPQHVTVYNIASSVTVGSKREPKATYTELAKTGPTAWAEKNVKALFDSESPTATKDQEDLGGPVSLAVAYEKQIDATEGAKSDGPGDEPKFKKTARVVVFGDSDWILNANLSVYANRDFVLNAVSWLVGEEGGISIRPKALRQSFAPISRENFVIILASSFIIPELILLFGLSVWWRRRAVAA